MKRRKSRIILGTTAVAAALTFGGCSGSQNTSPAESNTAVTAQENTAETADTAKTAAETADTAKTAGEEADTDVTAAAADTSETAAEDETAVEAATGENAVRVCVKKADYIVGPIGIVIADAMLGEITAEVARAVSQADAKRILIPFSNCDNFIAGVSDFSTGQLVDEAVHHLKKILSD